MPKDDVLQNDPFKKTAFAARIDILEAEVKYLREVSVQKDKQIKDMAEQFKMLSRQLFKVGQTTDAEVIFFMDRLSLYMPMDGSEKIMQTLAKNPQFKAAVTQALREYGAALAGGGGDIR